MKIIVLGASGTIGKAVAALFKEKGHEVIEVSRSTQPAVNMDDPASIDAFYDTQGPVDAVVSTAGNAAFTALDAITEEDVQLTLNSKLMGQVNMVRKGLKKLNDKGVFVITGGMLAYDPWPKTALIGMVNAGLEGFARAASKDLPDGQRIVVMHPPFVQETAIAWGMDGSPWPNAARVAESYLQVLEGKQDGPVAFVEGYQPA